METSLPVMLNVRGTHNQKSLDDARKLHNETAGSAPGMEAARSLSDMSHNVFVPVPKATKMSNTKENELLFIDFWADAAGLQKFFSVKEVQEQGAKLFSHKDPSVWMPAKGAFTFRVPSTSGKRGQYVGLIRAQIKSSEATIAAFAQVQSKGLAAARRRGLLSHDLYVSMGPPGAPLEICGVDVWQNLEGLMEHYANPAELAPIGQTFAGDPAASVWEQATGFNEW